MWQVFKIELFKIFRKPRTYIAFGAIAAFVMLIQLAMYLNGEEFLGFLLQSLEETFQIEGKTLNGYLVCFIILQSLLVHVPLLIALVAGDMVSGEAAMGTIRILAAKPISRSKLLLAKYFAALVYTFLLLLFLAVLGLFFSIMIFGTSDLINFKSGLVIFLDSDDVMWRYMGSFGFALLSMSVVASLAFLLSVFSENSIGPIVATICIIVVLTIFNTLELPLFTSFRPYLFTNHMLNWKGFFEEPVDYSEVLKSALVLIFHNILFVSLAIWSFRKKDILV